MNIELQEFDIEDIQLSIGNQLDMGWAEDGDIDEEAFDINSNDRNEDTRYIRPKVRKMKQSMVKYKYADELAKNLHVGEGERATAIVAGNFIFGDFIEAYLTTYDIKATRMIIATLSMSDANLVSLQALMENEYIEQLDLILSALFYGHERWQFIPQLYDALDMDNRFQLAVIGHHMKVCIFETDDNQHIVISGSANLRSSGSLEQFSIEESKELYDFYLSSFEGAISEYKTIQKDIDKSGNQIKNAISKRKVLNHEELWKSVSGEKD